MYAIIRFSWWQNPYWAKSGFVFCGAANRLFSLSKKQSLNALIPAVPVSGQIYRLPPLRQASQGPRFELCRLSDSLSRRWLQHKRVLHRPHNETSCSDHRRRTFCRNSRRRFRVDRLDCWENHEDWKQQCASRRPLRKSQRRLQTRRSKPKRADLIRRYRAKSIEIRCQLPCICTNGKRFGAEPTISVQYRAAS
jgi:hypothetical protein